MTNHERSLNAIRAFMTDNKWTKYRMCKEAGLYVGSLAKVFTNEWQPKSCTIQKIEAAIQTFKKSAKKVKK